MEHQEEDVPEEGTSKISDGEIITYVDNRITLLLCGIGIAIDIALIMGIISCVRHFIK